jgi:sugar transferase (PEP-CTERM/EpsH1 system associated)
LQINLDVIDKAVQHMGEKHALQRADLTLPRRILFVTHRVPYPPDKGDRIRTYHLIRFLSKHHQIYLASLADEPISVEARRALERLCAHVAFIPVSKSRWLRAGVTLTIGKSASIGAFHSFQLSNVLCDWQARYSFDLALASASSIAWYLRTSALKDVPAFVDLVDVDSQKWLDYSRASTWPKSWLYRRESTALRRTERRIASWAKQVLLVSDAESQLFEGIAPSANAATITNGVDLDYFSLDNQTPRTDTCVFVGALDYRPNVDAAIWFSRNVWPSIHAHKPRAECRLVGRNPVAGVRELARIPGIQVIGQVPDVRPYVRQATVAIAPLRLARGVQNKVLEAMAMGKPVVASPQACSGLRPGIPSPVIQARSLIEWKSALLDVWANADRAATIGQASRSYVEKYYCWERCLEPLLDRIETVCGVKTARRERKPKEPALISSEPGI